MRHQRLSILILSVFLTSLAGRCQTAQQVVPTDSLTLDRAIELAVQNHPLLRIAKSNIDVATSNRNQATAVFMPSLSASATFSRTSGAFVFNPAFPPRVQSYNSYSTGLQANYTLFDFGKSIQRASASGDLVDAARSDYEGSLEDVKLNVHVAYYGVIEAKQVLNANEEALASVTEHLKEAKAFYAAGKRAQIDVTRAEVDLANANVNLITSRNQLLVAKLQLENAMNFHPGTNYTVQDSVTREAFAMTLDSAMIIAYGHRPEFLSQKARVAAMKSYASAAWSQHLPTLSAFGTWTWSNFQLSPLFDRWNAGLSLSLPLFQGFSISAQVDQAQANVSVAEATFDLLKESIKMEVEQNYLSTKDAEERIAASTILVRQAEENLTLAEKQYTAGVGTNIEVSDAQLVLTNARITMIQALYDYNSAIIRLKRSIGIL